MDLPCLSGVKQAKYAWKGYNKVSVWNWILKKNVFEKVSDNQPLNMIVTLRMLAITKGIQHEILFYN